MSDSGLRPEPGAVLEPGPYRSQVIAHLPERLFRQFVLRYDGDRRVRSFSCWDQFLCMTFPQLTDRESLRGIESCLRALGERLYHLGIRGRVSGSTLADTNEKRDWRIYAAFAQNAIAIARRLYAEDPLDLELDQTVHALDSSTIDLCLSPNLHGRSQELTGHYWGHPHLEESVLDD